MKNTKKSAMNISELLEQQTKQDDNIFSKAAIHVHELYLSGEIEAPSQYVGWLDTIRSAAPNDVIKIYINSPGGNLDTAIQMVNALEETDATVIMVIEGLCMSAASMIFLAGDVFEVAEHSTIMIHTYSGGVFGKGNEMHAQAEYEKKWSHKLIKSIYKDFLTSSEISDVIKGSDIWLNADETVKKLEYRKKKREK